jgi:hypothetical protein
MPQFPITSSTVDWSRSCAVFPGVLILQESSYGIPSRRNRVIPFHSISPDFMVVRLTPSINGFADRPVSILVSFRILGSLLRILP